MGSYLNGISAIARHFQKYLGNCRNLIAVKIHYLCGVLGVRGCTPCSGMWKTTSMILIALKLG